MEFNEYQKRALSTAIFPNDNSITYLSPALCGEAGEIADKVKKVIRDQNGKYSPPDLEAIAMEIGDVLWHAANLAAYLTVRGNEVIIVDRKSGMEDLKPSNIMIDEYGNFML